MDDVELALHSFASSIFGALSSVDGPRRDIDAIGGSRCGHSLNNDGDSPSPDRMQESFNNRHDKLLLADKLRRDVLPFESAQVKYLQFILDYFISPHVIKVCENKRDNETDSGGQDNNKLKRTSDDLRYEGDPSFALPLMYIANLYETLVDKANARVDSVLPLLRGEIEIGLPLEAAGGLYRELSKKFPKKGTCMYKRRELAAAETRKKFPELVIPEETRIRFVVVYGLDIVEKPDNVPIEDAEWFKLVTGRNEVAVSARDYKFYCPRPKLKRDQNSVFSIPGLPMSNDGGVNDGGAEDDVGGTIRRKKRKQIVWEEDEHTGIYLKLLDMELAKLGYKQKLPKEVGRERICKGFLEKTGISLPWEFFKSKYSNLRNKYESYKRLVNFAGVSADHNTGLIDMDSQWWDDREKVIQYAKQIRENGIPHMKLMRRIFGRQEAMYSTHKQDEREPMDNAADDSNIIPTSDVHLQSQTISLESPPMDKSVPETHDNAADDDSNIVPTSDVHLQSQTISPESPPMSPIGPSKRSNREQSRVTTPYESNRGKDVSQSREENIPYKEAYGILQSIQGLTRWTDFWWSCIKVLKEDSFAREMLVYNESDDDRITFLEGYTGYDRYGKHIGNRFKALQS